MVEAATTVLRQRPIRPLRADALFINPPVGILIMGTAISDCNADVTVREALVNCESGSQGAMVLDRATLRSKSDRRRSHSAGLLADSR